MGRREVSSCKLFFLLVLSVAIFFSLVVSSSADMLLVQYAMWTSFMVANTYT